MGVFTVVERASWLALAFVGAFFAFAPWSALANHSQIQLAAPTTFAQPGDVDQVYLQGLSADGRKLWIRTDIALDPADTDAYYDLYEVSNGTITFVSPPPADAISTVGLAGTSDDTSRLFISTTSSIYRYANGATTLVSTGPTEPGCCRDATFLANSGDGSRALFVSDDPLVPEDTDGCSSDLGCDDVYERDVDAGTTTLISTGPSSSNGDYEASGSRTSLSRDGAHAFFGTAEQLVAEDTDPTFDVYERVGGLTRLVSIGPSGGNAPINSFFDVASEDGSRVIFETAESLVPSDVDGRVDLYERSNGTTTTLLSTGSAGGNGAFDVTFGRATADATRVFFSTDEGLVGSDLDSATDIYERSAGNTSLRSGGTYSNFLNISADGSHVYYFTFLPVVPEDTNGVDDIYDNSAGGDALVSIGPNGSGSTGIYPPPVLSSADGSRVFFETGASLISSDTDSSIDLYERFDGKTTLLSTGPAGGNSGFNPGFYPKASTDGTTIAFDTRDQLTADDTDFKWDAYARRVGTEHPASATHVHMALVPAFRQTISTTQCQSRGGAPSMHGTPLSSSSCNPPGYLPNTKAKLGPFASGSVDLNVIAGDPSTAADEADVSIAAIASDVRDRASGSDYGPNASGLDVTLNPLMRLTDTYNGGTLTDSATTVDFDFPVGVECVGTANPVTGSVCSVSTTADAVMPGFVKEGKQAVLSLNRFWFYDSGANATRGDADDRQFAQQGFYVP